MSVFYTLVFQRHPGPPPRIDGRSPIESVEERFDVAQMSKLHTGHLKTPPAKSRQLNVRINLAIPQGALRHWNRGQLIAKDAGPKLEAQDNSERATSAIPNQCV